jgi:hypothetical protein
MAPSATLAGGVRKGILTRDLVIEKILRWNALYGEPPCTADWNPSLARWRAQEWRIERYRLGDPETGERWPSVNAAKRHFDGSFDAAVRAAGLVPHRPGPRRRPARSALPAVAQRAPLPPREVEAELVAAGERVLEAERRALRAEERVRRAVARAERAESAVAEARDRARGAERRAADRVRAAERHAERVRVAPALESERRARAERRRAAAELRAAELESALRAADARAAELERALHAAEARAAELEARASIHHHTTEPAPEAASPGRDVACLEARLRAAEARGRAAEAARRAAEARAARPAAEAVPDEAPVAARAALAPAVAAQLRNGNGPVGPGPLADALKALAKARASGDRVALNEALARVATAAARWRERL